MDEKGDISPGAREKSPTTFFLLQMLNTKELKYIKEKTFYH